MKSLFKVCLVLLLSVALLSCIVACGDDETTPEITTVTPTNPNPDTNPTTPSSTVADSEPVTTVTQGEATVTAPVCASHTPSTNGSYCTVCYTVLENNEKDYKNMIYFACDNETLTEAYKVAIADITGNIVNYGAGVLTSEVPCLMAGADYDTPWTRDAAINVWNGFALMNPEVSKNTLLSVLKRTGSQYQIDGQYWDAIIWSIGAYQLINVTHDMEFAAIAQNAITNSLKRFEREEYDAKDGLFRGPAVYGDGIAGYPDHYAVDAPNPGVGGFKDNPANADKIIPIGEGLPMKALSTNCCYYEAYVIQAKLNAMLGKDTTVPLQKAEAMKAAINKAFWNEEKGTYDYLAYECDYQEAIGLGFVLLFGIADERQTALVLQNTQVTENGIAIVWPCFDRYLALGGYGRHAGVIWPHGQAFWARACSQNGYRYGYEYEMFLMAEKAVRDGQFYEIYHPDTGAVYGGIQEFGPNNFGLWGSCAHQTWSATGYVSLVYYELLGAEIGEKSVTFKPYLPEGVNEATVSGFKVGNMTFDIVITRGTDTATTATFDTTVEGTVRLHLSVN
ncbi:MAG: hypothetical protein IJW46_01790 [Clostridia bacterium]|nr:hypothetical protein [Clostridia bacterium]